MKVFDAIRRASAVYPELEFDERVYPWLSEIEERICTELALQEFGKISKDQDENELCAPEYYTEVYPLYLVMKADLSNSDHSRYVCHSSAFNSVYAELANYFMRNRIPSSRNYYKFL